MRGKMEQQSVTLFLLFGIFRIIGSVLIVAGLYSVLWGKHKENVEKKEIEATEIPVAIKGVDGNGRIMDMVELDEVELEKAQANGKAVTISVPASAGEAARMQRDDEN